MMSTDTNISRRRLLSLLGLSSASLLTGCASYSARPFNSVQPGTLASNFAGDVRSMFAGGISDDELAVMYGTVEDGGYVIPAVPSTAATIASALSTRQANLPEPSSWIRARASSMS